MSSSRAPCNAEQHKLNFGRKLKVSLLVHFDKAHKTRERKIKGGKEKKTKKSFSSVLKCEIYLGEDTPSKRASLKRNIKVFEERRERREKVTR